MGLSNSKIYISNSGVFQKELEHINNVVYKVLNKNDMYKNDNFNFFLKNKCNEITLVNSNRLYKYPKYTIDDIHSAIFLIDNNELKKTKKYLCNKISYHVTRILKIIYLIKYIYDLENNGDNSIGGIILRNIQINNDLFKVKYCDDKQEEIFNSNQGINFTLLSGFDVFMKHMLSESEAKIFHNQLSVMLGRNDKKSLKKWICKDLIISEDTYDKLHKTKFVCHSGGSSKSDNNYYVKVSKENPIFSWRYCSLSREYISKTNNDVKNALKDMKSNYKKNFNKIEEILNKLIIFDNREYSIQNLTSNQLSVIESDFKKIVMLFFIQSIQDYKNVLNIVKKYSINE